MVPSSRIDSFPKLLSVKGSGSSPLPNMGDLLSLEETSSFGRGAGFDCLASGAFWADPSIVAEADSEAVAVLSFFLPLSFFTDLSRPSSTLSRPLSMALSAFFSALCSSLRFALRSSFFRKGFCAIATSGSRKLRHKAISMNLIFMILGSCNKG